MRTGRLWAGLPSCVRRMASAAAAVPATFPISSSLRVSDVSERLRMMDDAEMRGKFELDDSVTVADAVKHLAKHRLTFVCVTDKSQGGRVVGMFSERDYLRYAVRAEASAFFSGKSAAEENITRAMSAAERMLSLRRDTTVYQALSMVQHKIWRHLPVLDDNERLTAILDIRNLLLTLDGGRSDSPADAQPPGGHLRSVWHGKSVADILRTKRREKIVEGTSLELYLRTRAATHTIASSATIERAAKQMARERLTFLVIVEEDKGARHSELFVPSPFEKNRVVGLVNERDFVHFGARHDDGLGAHASTPVRTIMTPLENVQHVSITDSVSTCVDLLFARNVRHLPVIDGEHLFGVVSLRDVLRPMLPDERESVLAGADHGQVSAVWRRTQGGNSP